MSTAVDYELFFDTLGFVFEIRESAGGRKINELPLWRMFPAKGDTVYEASSKNNIYVYDTLSADSTVELLPRWKSTVDQPIYRFKKGVGRIGTVLPSMASRLIEYRIGTGPVVKKHWQMQSSDSDAQ